MATLLLEKGADIEAQDDNNMTPLLIAAQCGDVAMIKLLVEKRANVNAQDESDVTPTHHAANNGNTEMIKLLAENGANVNATYMNMNMNIHNETNESSVTPLYLAIKNGKIDTAKALIELGARGDVSLVEDQFPILHLAAQQGQLAVVQWLVSEAKADVEAKQYQGGTPLMLAVDGKHTKTAKWLARHANADTRVKSDLGSAVDLARRAEAASAPQDARRARRLAEWLARPCGQPGCEARGKKLCSRCERGRYCSVECQAAHWHMGHKQECRAA